MQTPISSINGRPTLGSTLKAQTPIGTAGKPLSLGSLRDAPVTLGSRLVNSPASGSALRAQTPIGTAGKLLSLDSLRDAPATLGNRLCNDRATCNSLQYVETSKREVSCCIKTSQGNTYTLHYSETSQRRIRFTNLSYALTNST